MLESAHSLCHGRSVRSPYRTLAGTETGHYVMGDRRGSTLVAALALAFLVFAITILCVARVAASYAQISMRHNQTSALFLAEAGIQKAAAALLSDSSYAGEKGTKLPTGAFDVSVTRSGGGYVVTSTGHADTPFQKKPRKSIRAVVTITGGGSFRLSDWRENP